MINLCEMIFVLLVVVENMKIYGNLYLPETIFEFNLILAGSRTPLFE